MLQRFLFIALTLCSLSATAQWQQTGSKVRYVNGLGIPTKDTAAGVAADSSQIVIRPADSALYIKYKRTWLRVGGGGGSIAGGGAAGQVSFFTGASAISGDSALFWDNTNKRLGIHTKNPGKNLDIHGTNIIAQFNGTGTNNAYLDFQNAGSTQWRIGNQYAAAVNRYSIYNAAGALECLTILQSGNIGIGYNAPAAKLAVSGTTLINTNTDNGLGDKLQVNGSAAFSSSVMATSAIFANNSVLSIVMGSPQLRLINNAAASINQRVDLGLRWEDGTYNGIGGISMIRESATARSGTIVIQPINSSGDPLAALSITSTGAATFSSSVTASQFKLSALNTAPSSAGDTGTLGEIRIDANYIYICTATNTWKRVAIATW